MTRAAVAVVAAGLVALGARARQDAPPVSAAAAAPGGDGAAWLAARPDFAWRFPRDHWSHPGYRTEWWYFTGHLAGPADTGARFGYQFTVFRVGLLPDAPSWRSTWAATDLVMGHAAVTDLRTGQHVFSEILYRAVPLLGGFGAPGDPLLAWSLAPPGTPTRWTLAWNGRGFDFAMRDDPGGIAFTLSTRATKPLVFQGPNGHSRKGAAGGAASQYYSFTRLATSGTLRVGPETLTVRGESWMDKEFGSNQLADDQVGWDWFSLQLDDGRDLMLYVLRDAAGGPSHARGTLVAPDGRPRWLEAAEFSVAASARWRGPTGTEYPARWRVRVPLAGLDLDVAPRLAAQENRSRLIPGLEYWEGAVDVRAEGRHVGRGYVELTGYAARTRLPL
jgi:predicted secreted hydrolase